MREPDWDKAPEWAQYYAEDLNGIGRWYEYKPKLITSLEEFTQDTGIVETVDNNYDYKKSYRKRPTKEEKEPSFWRTLKDLHEFKEKGSMTTPTTAKLRLLSELSETGEEFNERNSGLIHYFRNGMLYQISLYGTESQVEIKLNELDKFDIFRFPRKPKIGDVVWIVVDFFAKGYTSFFIDTQEELDRIILRKATFFFTEEEAKAEVERRWRK